MFGEVGAYVLLLILQRKPRDDSEPPPAVMVRCREFVGNALEDALEGKRVSNGFYEIYEVQQDTFAEDDWLVLPPGQMALRRRLRRLPRLDKFLHVKQGLVTGLDDVFIVDGATVPKKERSVYRPLLSDREMQRYRVPTKVAKAVFYPYIHREKLDGARLRRDFPQTWDYLKSRQAELKARSSVRKGTVEWWSPERPRAPESLFRPKIVSPHLILLPRFSLDADGRFAVSHSPLMYPARTSGEDVAILRYFVAVLNSSVVHWQIMTGSHRYSRGYAMLEVKTLRRIAVPDPAEVPVAAMKKLQALVERRLADTADTSAEDEIDRLVADIYSLSGEDCSVIGIEQ